MFRKGRIASIVTLACLLLTKQGYGQIVQAREQARAELAKKGISYSDQEFVERAGEGDIAAVQLFLDSGMNPNVHVEGCGGGTALSVASWEGRADVVELLIEKGANVDFRVNDDEDTALINASDRGHLDVVSILLNNGASVNIEGHWNQTALIHAGWRGHLEVARLLIAREAVVDATDNYGNTALGLASESGQAETARLLLLSGANVNAMAQEEVACDDCSGSWNGTPLMRALRDGSHQETVEVLLEHGADVNLGNICATPLLRAIEDDAEFVLPLLSKGADVNAREQCHGTTPLMMAVETPFPDIDVIRALVERGANINAKDKGGSTALIHAIGFGQTQETIVRLLLENGADPNVRNIDGDTALIRAAYSDLAILRLLLDRKVDVNAANNKGETALMLTPGFGRLDNAKLLLQHGADINAKSTNGRTALIRAAEYQSAPDLVKLFLEKGAEVDAQDADGKTALMHAVANDCKENARLLLANGADPNLPDKYGVTPMAQALLSGDIETIRMLKDSGGRPPEDQTATSLQAGVLAQAQEIQIYIPMEAERTGDFNIYLSLLSAGKERLNIKGIKLPVQIKIYTSKGMAEDGAGIKDKLVYSGTHLLEELIKIPASRLNTRNVEGNVRWYEEQNGAQITKYGFQAVIIATITLPDGRTLEGTSGEVLGRLNNR